MIRDELFESTQEKYPSICGVTCAGYYLGICLLVYICILEQ